MFPRPRLLVRLLRPHSPTRARPQHQERVHRQPGERFQVRTVQGGRPLRHGGGAGERRCLKFRKTFLKLNMWEMLQISVQMVLSVAWTASSPPSLVLCQCQKMANFQVRSISQVIIKINYQINLKFQETFFYSLSYPVFLGVVICALSGLSLKWRTNSGATSNILALMASFATW